VAVKSSNILLPSEYLIKYLCRVVIIKPMDEDEVEILKDIRETLLRIEN